MIRPALTPEQLQAFVDDLELFNTTRLKHHRDFNCGACMGRAWDRGMGTCADHLIKERLEKLKNGGGE